MTTIAEARSSPPRDDNAWVLSLEDPGPLGDGARRELRVVLMTGLQRVLARRGVAADVCEDFAQEALLRIRDRLGSYRGESRFTTWALAIATRVAFDELRHKRWKDVSFDDVAAGAQEPVAFERQVEATPEESLVRERVLGALRDAIESDLTPRQRAVLQAELSGMPQAEIAAQLGMKRNALYKLAHDARRKVKAKLESSGISEVEALECFRS